ncbi:DUF6000 family protein [Streptomyces humicola]|uniref:DUF6000 family protein n=1 Tax=Streptomyces humicola TaxID=2953240 RepID=UPI0027E296E3|nr:DUF6000 family protein [Streptomyces humicola]
MAPNRTPRSSPPTWTTTCRGTTASTTQPWALGALLHIDELRGTNHAGRFLQPDGLWQQWAKGRFDAAVLKKRIDELSSYVDKGPDLA